MNRRHRCPGEECGICAAAISAAEDARDFPEPFDDRMGEAAFDRYLDQLGGWA